MHSTPPTPSSRVCIIYAGGTMGSKPNESGLLAPAPLTDFQQRVEALKQSDWSVELGFKQVAGDPIDSANASPADWMRVRDALESNWQDYDGFVVVHGTDTLPYLAAFLSFAIDFQNKPVVVTGSMHPIFDEGDAAANLKASILVAAYRAIDQVLVCFGGQIFRGNRTTKLAADDNAFSSPRVPAIGAFECSGPNLGHPTWEAGHPRQVVGPSGKLEFKPLIMSEVVLIRLFPGMTTSFIEAVAKNAEGVVVEAYGSGTGPEAIREHLEDLACDGKFVVVTTGVIWGKATQGQYATDLVQRKSPLILGNGLLTEAAVAKLHYVLGSCNRGMANWQKYVRSRMQQSIRGEYW